MQERHLNREQYFNEQVQTSLNHYVPYIKGFCGRMPGTVLEIGCGEGGNLLPFAQYGADVTGVDLAAGKIDNARHFFESRGVKGRFIAKDIFKLTELRNTFSLIIIHDVIEHIYDKELFLKGIKEYLAPDGIVFVAFPPWQMPFGGHQQIASSRILSHLPFIHLMPVGMYRALLKLFNEPEPVISELIDIKRTNCTVERFLSVAEDSGYEILDRRLYFINPNYEVKFGLTPRILWKPFSEIPYLRNFLATSAFFMLKG